MPVLPTQPTSIIKPRLVVGEGPDDFFFLSALVAELHLDQIQVDHTGGKDKLPVYLRELSRRTGYQILQGLAVVRDADADCAEAFRKASGALSAVGFRPPQSPGQWSGSIPNIGVFIVPDNSRPGMLEDLCLESIQSDPAFLCLTQFFECALKQSKRNPVPASKARVIAWLSIQENMDDIRNLGLASYKKCWPWTSTAFGPLADFLRLM